MQCHTLTFSEELTVLSVRANRFEEEGDFTQALEEWRKRSTLLGRKVEVTREGRPLMRGVARDIAEDGALLVGSERIVAGDVRALE